MQKLIKASLLLIFLVVTHSEVFARTLDCKFVGLPVEGVESIQISDQSILINQDLEVPLSKSKIKCGNFGKQTRFDGTALGYQIILKTCTTDGEMKGSLIDQVKAVAADILCGEKLQ